MIYHLSGIIAAGWEIDVTSSRMNGTKAVETIEEESSATDTSTLRWYRSGEEGPSYFSTHCQIPQPHVGIISWFPTPAAPAIRSPIGGIL
jgi:hypothetical protein